MEAYAATTRRGGGAAIREASRFFMQADAVSHSLHAITERLGSLKIPYAVIDGMALVVHGYRRTTEDVDILVTSDGLKAVHESLVGAGYQPLYEKSKNLRDTRTGVRIEFIVSGGYPGDGKPKPVAFPEPASVGVEIDGVRYATLPTLIELKLTSGMSSPGRLRDLADVQELIRVLNLPGSLADQLHPYVRKKFLELSESVHGDSEQLTE